MLTLDHIAIAATDLKAGCDWVEERLGVTLQPGGQHDRYGTHNMLLGLGDLYLEVIAPDPANPVPRPRWFNLDRFAGPPRPANWICRSDDLAGLLQVAPAAVGPAQDLQRGNLSWQITVPPDGSLPFDGAYPTLMQWAKGTCHPATRLPDSGCRLTGWQVSHPKAARIAAMLPLIDPRVTFVDGDPGFRATFDTPHGPRSL